MCEQSALAHAEVVGEPADGQTLETLERSKIDCSIQDALPRAFTLHA
jgi:hypothetical protein